VGIWDNSASQFLGVAGELSTDALVECRPDSLSWSIRNLEINSFVKDPAFFGKQDWAGFFTLYFSEYTSFCSVA
jgi:hypothetical protein